MCRSNLEEGLYQTMNKRNIVICRFFVTLLTIAIVCSSLFAATTPAKQLARGKQLFEQNKNDEAMDAFIEVLVNGSRAEVEEANQYINKLHNRMGGIQDPVEVAEDYAEGTISHVNSALDPVVLQEQLDAQTAPIEQEVRSAGLAATAQADAAALAAQQRAEALAAEANQYSQQQIEEAAAQLRAQQEALLAKEAELQAKQDEILAQQAAAKQALQNQLEDYSLDEETKVTPVAAVTTPANTPAANTNSSTFADLTSPAALQARQIYTAQKLESMMQAAVAKLEKEKGVRLYFRNGKPDAIDVDSEVLFDGYKFRPEALPVLDEIYTLMALTQDASYVILPPGSYTDNITLSGIRQAMALNSFLVHKGLSSGKLSYNMGLFDQEPPAKFANLDGVSIVFDYDTELPSSLPDATSVTKKPLLSMAVVPVSNKISPCLGEAFAVDFSVIETENPIDNWVLQVVQHGARDTYYIVRQVEGFSPVYHQILWNGRKGIIGQELPCGKYTFALTGTDVQGAKQTLRRQVEVLCCNGTQNKIVEPVATASTLNYKEPRLWTKPGRVMMKSSGYVAAAPAKKAAVAADDYSGTHTEINKETTYTELADGSIEKTVKTTTTTTSASDTTTKQGVVNPYDMPYED